MAIKYYLQNFLLGAALVIIAQAGVVGSESNPFICTCVPPSSSNVQCMTEISDSNSSVDQEQAQTCFNQCNESNCSGTYLCDSVGNCHSTGNTSE